jgi:hypothetical protein
MSKRLLSFPSTPPSKSFLSFLFGLAILLEISLGTPIIRSSGSEILNTDNNLKSTTQTVKKRPSKNVTYNDGTANKTDYFLEDDMLFLKRAKQNRAGQSKESYRWPGGRIPYAFAPGYCKHFYFIGFLIVL